MNREQDFTLTLKKLDDKGVSNTTDLGGWVMLTNFEEASAIKYSMLS